MKKDTPKTILAENRKARFDYEIIEQFEAGIELFGEEVKSIRKGSANLKGSYILITSGRPYIVGMHVSEWKGGMRKIDPKRERNILIKEKEILTLSGKISTLGATLIPLEIYTKGNLIKVWVGLGRGRKRWEKKQVLKERDLDRELHKIYR